MSTMSNYQSVFGTSRIVAECYTELDNIFSFLINSSIFLAIVGSLKLYCSFMLYDIQVDFKLICASFFLVFATYGFDKLNGGKEDVINLPQRAAFIKRNKRYLIFSVVLSYAVVLILCFLQNIYAVLIVLFPLLTGFIYSKKIRNFRLKDKIGLKNIIIGISWASGVALLPLTVHSKNLMIPCFIFYFFFIKSVITTILFDVRDVKGDSLNKVITIPVFLGIKATKKILILLNSTAILWLTCCYLLGLFNCYFVILGFSIIYGYWYIQRFCRTCEDTGNSMRLLINGEWILFAILTLLLNIWRSNPLSFVKLAQIANVLDKTFLSCASVWVVCHFYVGFSLFSVLFLIYAARKINRSLNVEEELRLL